MNSLVILMFIVACSGFAALVISFTAIRRLTAGVLRSYATSVWYALILFSIGGGLHSYAELTGNTYIAGLNIVNIQYIFYALYYIMLLFGFFLIFRLYIELGFDQKVKGMRDAIAEMEKRERGE